VVPVAGLGVGLIDLPALRGVADMGA